MAILAFIALVVGFFAIANNHAGSKNAAKSTERGSIKDLPVRMLSNMEIKKFLYTENMNMSVFYIHMPAGFKAEAKLHPENDEFFYMVKGENKGIIGGKEYLLKKGDYMFIPRGTKHQFYTEDSEVEVISIFNPPLENPKTD